MRLRTPLASLMALMLLSASCGLPTISCTLEARPSLVVILRDAANGNALPVVSRVTALGTQHRDSVEVPANTSEHTFDEGFVGPDTYTVTVRAEGYRTWTRDGIRVEGGRCHVEAPTVTTTSLARL